MAARIDIENHRLDDLAFFQNLGGVFYALGPGQVRNMHQTVDTFFDFDEGPEIGHIADAALHYRTDAVAAIDGSPWIWLELFQAERNSTFPGMHFENNGFHLIARMHDFGGVLHSPRPGHFADVDQPFDACLQFDECAVIGHVDNTPNDTAV